MSPRKMVIRRVKPKAGFREVPLVRSMYSCGPGSPVFSSLTLMIHIGALFHGSARSGRLAQRLLGTPMVTLLGGPTDMLVTGYRAIPWGWGLAQLKRVWHNGRTGGNACFLLCGLSLLR